VIGAAADTVPPQAPPVERQLVVDIAKRGLMVAPAIVLLAAAVKGGAGAASAAFAVAVVLANLGVSGAALSWAARTSLDLLMIVSLGGFLVRMGVLVGVIAAVRHESWVDLPTLAITLFVTQIGLLLWETRYVSASLAYPALKPSAGKER
jgi:hypothetical protein